MKAVPLSAKDEAALSELPDAAAGRGETVRVSDG